MSWIVSISLRPDHDFSDSADRHRRFEQSDVELLLELLSEPFVHKTDQTRTY
jgi:hypothetical protein